MFADPNVPRQSTLTRACAIAFVVTLGLVALVDGAPWIFHHVWTGALTKTSSFLDGTVTKRLESELQQDSRVFQNLGPAFNWAGYLLFDRSGSLVVPGHEGWMFYHSTISLPEEEEYRRLLKSYGTMFQLLNRLLTKEKQAPFYLLQIPDKALVYPEYLKDDRFLEQRNKDLDNFNQNLRKKGVKVVDLRDAFRQHRDSADSLLFYPDDTHWSTTGAELAAAEIAKLWRDEIDLQRHEFRFEDVPVYKVGDMPRMLRFPKPVIEKFHTQLITRPQMIVSPSLLKKPQFTLYGTSYSEGQHLSDRLGLATKLVPLDKSQAALRIDDMILKIVHGLYFENRTRPLRPILLEFPVRYLHRSDTVPETLAQLRLHAYTIRWQPLHKIPLTQCKLYNLKHVRDDIWQPQNTDPIIEIFADQWASSAELKPKFMRLKLRVEGSFPSQNHVRIYYDMGDGFQLEDSRDFKLVGYPDWQVIIIPLTWRGKTPQRIRIDPIGRDWTLGIRDLEVL